MSTAVTTKKSTTKTRRYLTHLSNVDQWFIAGWLAIAAVVLGTVLAAQFGLAGWDIPTLLLPLLVGWTVGWMIGATIEFRNKERDREIMEWFELGRLIGNVDARITALDRSLHKDTEVFDQERS